MLIRNNELALFWEDLMDKIIETGDIKDLFKKRDINANKGDFGKAGIYGGSIEYSGALKLSYLSLSALRSGCGISRVIVKKEILPLLGPNILEQTINVLPEYNNNFYNKLNDYIKDLDALAFGMGLGNDEHLEEILDYLIKNYRGNLIIDADGLNILSKMDLNVLKKRKGNILLTPHLKEFSRLCNKSIAEIKKDSIILVKEFASTYNITLLLKGHTTIISDGSDVYSVATGTPGMATAGSGDVLSGILVGLLAYLDFNLLTVAAGVLINGIAGELAEEDNTDISMMARDTVSNIGKAIKIIRNGD